MKVMLTVYYDEQDKETTRVVYDPEWLQTNEFLQVNTLSDAAQVISTAWLVACRNLYAERSSGEES